MLTNPICRTQSVHAHRHSFSVLFFSLVWWLVGFSGRRWRRRDLPVVQTRPSLLDTPFCLTKRGDTHSMYSHNVSTCMCMPVLNYKLTLSWVSMNNDLPLTLPHLPLSLSPPPPSRPPSLRPSLPPSLPSSLLPSFPPFQIKPP